MRSLRRRIGGEGERDLERMTLPKASNRGFAGRSLYLSLERDLLLPSGRLSLDRLLCLSLERDRRLSLDRRLSGDERLESLRGDLERLRERSLWSLLSAASP